MKKEYKYGLFFLLFLTVVLMAVLIWRRQIIDQASDKNGNQRNDAEEVPIDAKEAPYNNSDEISQVQGMEIRTTSDTMCIYENMDKKDGSVFMEEKKIPAKYVGLKREELAAMLTEDGKVLMIEEEEKGFQSQHLELFSAEKIKILRIYDTAQELTGYYIMEMDGEVCVFKHDKTSLYFKTGVRAEDLPPAVRSEIQEGKYMENELQVFHFIESYSS